MTNARSGLIISNKNTPQQSPTSFRQIENWANGGKWTDIVLANNFANDPGFQSAQYFIDPFGFVHLRGLIVYTGTLTSGATQTTMFTLPVTYAPIATELILVLLRVSATSTVDAGILYVLPSGVVAIVNQTGSTTVNPYISINNVTFMAGF